VQAELTDFGMKAFLTGLDLAQLRPDVDAECLLRFVLLFLKGLEQEYLGRGDLSSLDWEQIIKEFMVYVELLRTGIGSQCGSDRDPHMG